MSARILAVDDRPENVRLLEAILVPAGYEVIGAQSGQEAMEKVRAQPPDLVLTDVVMPGMNGYELCRRLRADPATAFLPIVVVTASGGEEKREALEAGADDYVAKPFDKTELLARVRSLLRVKAYHDMVERQKLQLARFLSPQIVELVSSPEGETLLAGHRREITVVVCDLRNFTAFSETAEPEEALALLRSYQACMGEEIVRFGGTLEHFAGDGILVWFNDPLLTENHQLRAIQMAVAMRERFEALNAGWRKKGYPLGFGVGIAVGYATLGRIGFEGRYDYGAVGNVVILASRLGGAAEHGQILISQRLFGAVEDAIQAAPVGELTLKGLMRPVPAYNVTALKRVPA